MFTRFILLHTSHAGNVGAVARAMKVMGFDDLVLVQPRWPDVLLRPEALERASGAVDVLEKARVVQTWEEAVEEVEYLCASAMTARDFGPPTVEPRTHFSQLVAPHGHAGAPLRSLGLVFGCERYGMSNEQVYRCNACLRIPTNPAYGSLNLAAAVQLLAYEWRLALGGFAQRPEPSGDASRRAVGGGNSHPAWHCPGHAQGGGQQALTGAYTLSAKGSCWGASCASSVVVADTLSPGATSGWASAGRYTSTREPKRMKP